MAKQRQPRFMLFLQRFTDCGQRFEIPCVLGEIVHQLNYAVVVLVKTVYIAFFRLKSHPSLQQQKHQNRDAVILLLNLFKNVEHRFRVPLLLSTPYNTKAKTLIMRR